MNELTPVEFWSKVFDWYNGHPGQDRYDAECYFLQSLKDAE